MSDNQAGETPDVDIQETDVLVIGGGPAGSTLAALLAEKGRQVTLLEKDHHPRFHIGESLLPMTLPILERLGVLEEVRAIGMVKYGAEFVCPESERSSTFYFRNALDKNHPYAFQVRRAEFDEILFRNAARKGARLHEGMRVTEMEMAEGGRQLIHALDDQGQAHAWRARYLIDATGRDTFLARRLGWKQKNPIHNSAAIFGHFDNVERRAGEDEGNIGIYWFEHGWFWMIPLRDGSMSVGAVCWPEYLKTRETPPHEFLMQTIELCPGVAKRMRGARSIGEVRATGNFSYRSTHSHGPGYMLVGDAFTFVDPVFSSGVHLAMSGACIAADAVEAVLDEDPRADEMLAEYERRVGDGLATVSWFIYRFTSPVIRHLFMNPGNHLRMQEAVTSMLAGDFFRDTPTAKPLRFFRLLYYTLFIFNLPRAWRNYRKRARNTLLRFSGGTTPQDQLD